jgi:hypothetical protein
VDFDEIEELKNEFTGRLLPELNEQFATLDDLLAGYLEWVLDQKRLRIVHSVIELFSRPDKQYESRSTLSIDQLILLIDPILAQLPLEALDTFKHAQIGGLSRDFSLQSVYNRLNGSVSSEEGSISAEGRFHTILDWMKVLDEMNQYNAVVFARASFKSILSEFISRYIRRNERIYNYRRNDHLWFDTIVSSFVGDNKSKKGGSKEVSLLWDYQIGNIRMTSDLWHNGRNSRCRCGEHFLHYWASPFQSREQIRCIIWSSPATFSTTGSQMENNQTRRICCQVSWNKTRRRSLVFTCNEEKMISYSLRNRNESMIDWRKSMPPLFRSLKGLANLSQQLS